MKYYLLLLLPFFAGVTDASYSQTSTLAGYVVDKRDGTPITRAIVSLNGMLDTTDYMGYYRLTDVPFGTRQLKVWAPGYKFKEESIGVAAEWVKANFQLQPLALNVLPGTTFMYNLKGFAYNINNLQPIAGAQVKLIPVVIDVLLNPDDLNEMINQGGAAALYASQLLSISTGAPITVLTGNDGYFEFLGLPQGGYTFECMAPGYEPYAQSINLNQSFLVNFLLKADPSSVSGKVERWILNNDGSAKVLVPAAEATVEIKGIKDGKGIYGPFITNVGSDGSYTFGDLPPGDFWLYAWTPGCLLDSIMVSFMPGTNLSNVDFKLDYKSANLEIKTFSSTYVKNGEFLPLSGVEVNLSFTIGRDTTQYRIKKTTEMAGKVMLADLPPGFYNLKVMDSTLTDGAIQAKFPAKEISFTLGAEQDTIIELDITPIPGIFHGRFSTKDSLELFIPHAMEQCSTEISYVDYFDADFLRDNLDSATVEVFESDFMGYSLADEGNIEGTTNDFGNVDLILYPANYKFKVKKERYHEEKIDVTIGYDSLSCFSIVTTAHQPFEAMISSDSTQEIEGLVRPKWDYVYGRVQRKTDFFFGSLEPSPLDGFIVTLASNQQNFEAESNKKGLFLITKVPGNNQYVLEVAKPGYSLAPEPPGLLEVKGLGLIVFPIIVPKPVTADLEIHVFQGQTEIGGVIQLEDTVSCGRTTHFVSPSNPIIKVPVSDRFNILYFGNKYYNLGQWNGTPQSFTISLDQDGNAALPIATNITVKGYVSDLVTGVSLSNVSIILTSFGQMDTTMSDEGGQYHFQISSPMGESGYGILQFSYDTLLFPNMRFYSDTTMYIGLEPGCNRLDVQMLKDRGAIHGNVKGKKSGNPVEGVSIIVPSPQNNKKTNINGEFDSVLVKRPTVLSPTETPKVTIRFQKQGYFPVKKDNVEIKIGESTPLNTINTQALPLPFVEDFRIVSHPGGPRLQGHVLKGLKKGKATKATIEVMVKRLHPDSTEMLLTQEEADFNIANWKSWVETNDPVKAVNVRLELAGVSTGEVIPLKLIGGSSGRRWSGEIDLADLPVTIKDFNDPPDQLKFVVEGITSQGRKGVKSFSNTKEPDSIHLLITEPPRLMDFFSGIILGAPNGFDGAKIELKFKPFEFKALQVFKIERLNVGDHVALNYELSIEVGFEAAGESNPWMELVGGYKPSIETIVDIKVEPLPIASIGTQSMEKLIYKFGLSKEATLKNTKEFIKFLKIICVGAECGFGFNIAFEGGDQYYLPTHTGSNELSGFSEKTGGGFTLYLKVSAGDVFAPFKVLELVGFEVEFSLEIGAKEISMQGIYDRQYYPIRYIPIADETLTVTPYGKLSTSIDASLLGKFELSGEASVEAEWTELTLLPKKATLFGEINYELRLLIFYKKGTILKGAYVIRDKGTQSTVTLTPIEEVFLVNRDWNKPGYAEYSWQGGESKGTVLKKGYPFMRPFLSASKEGVGLITFGQDEVEDNLPKSLKSRFTFWDPGSKDFTLPDTITSNAVITTATAFADNGSPVAVWTGVDSAGYSNMFANLTESEIFYAIYDFAQDKWGDPAKLTNSAYGNLTPVLATDKEGNMVLVWITDPDGNPFTLDDRMLSYSIWENGQFTAPLIFAENMGISSVPSVAAGNGKVACVYVTDIDRNCYTYSDREIYYQERQSGDWTAPQKISSYPSIYEFSSLTLFQNGGGSIAWVSRGISQDTLYLYDLANGQSTVLDSAQQISSLQLLSASTNKLFLLWSEQNGDSTSLWMRTRADSIWSQRILLDNGVGESFSDISGDLDIQNSRVLLVYTSLMSNDSTSKDLRFLTLGVDGITNRTDLQIQKGWNLISSYVDPTDPDMLRVFEPVKDETIIVKDGAGKVVVPAGTINQIGNWTVTEGYQVKSQKDTLLPIVGTRVPSNTPIPLIAGWQIIAYLRDNPMPASSALAGLGGSVILAKNNAGKVFVPAYGINDIANMEPGQGYWLKTNKSGTLIYPAALTGPPDSDFAQKKTAQATQHFILDATNTGNNATLIVPAIAVEGLIENGDEIGVFSPGGVLCGAAVFGGQNLAITIWGDDAATPAITEYLAAGQTFVLRCWKAGTNEEFTPDFALESGAAVYQPNGFYVLSFVTGAPEASELAEFNYFPNPAAGSLHLRFGLTTAARLRIELFSADGKALATLLDRRFSAGTYSFDFGLAEYAAGLHFLRVRTDSGSRAYPLVLEKK